MNRVRFVSSFSVGALTIATALLVATPVTASTGEDVTVASGTVQSGSGVPVQARVIAYAWPSNAAVAATPEGGGLQLFPVGSVLTSAAGSYTLNLAPEDLEMFTDAFGNVNLEIVSVTADGRSAATSTSLSTDSGVEGAPLTMAEATPDLTVITQSAPKGTDADLLADFVDMGQSPTQAAASASHSRPPPADPSTRAASGRGPCGWGEPTRRRPASQVTWSMCAARTVRLELESL